MTAVSDHYDQVPPSRMPGRFIQVPEQPSPPLALSLQTLVRELSEGCPLCLAPRSCARLVSVKRLTHHDVLHMPPWRAAALASAAVWRFVHVRSSEDDTNPWLARVLALVAVEVPATAHAVVQQPGYVHLAIVQWLVREAASLGSGIRSYGYLRKPEAVDIESISHPVLLLENPVPNADGTHHLCALPYGKSGAWNALQLSPPS